MKKLLFAVSIVLTIQASAQEANEVSVNSKKNVLKIFPNPSNSGSFQISSSEKTNLYFYVFDISGTMIYQTILKGKEKQIIQNLNKGIYVYDVFKEDEGIEHGRLVVK